MKRYDNLRINVFFGLVLLLSGLILYRLFVLSVLKNSFYSLTAEAQNENVANILARGNIYVKDGENDFLAAVNKKIPAAYIVPAYLKNGLNLELPAVVTRILGIDAGMIEKTIAGGGDAMKILARNLTNEQVAEIKNLKIKGLGITYETVRFYPGGSFASAVIGFLGYSENGRAGQYGAEDFFEKELSGLTGQKASVFAGNSAKKVLGVFESAINYFKKNSAGQEDKTRARPADIVLTIDKTIQEFTEEKLDGLLSKWNAIGATIIVQEPFSGKILAMADRPTFNPNNYWNFKPNLFLNRSVQEIFEPGSSYKPFTMAMGLDLGKITPQTAYTDTGSVTVAGKTIKNFSEKIFGQSTMSEVLEKSINTGVMFVENLIGDESFLNYTVNSGFGQKTGIGLPGEASGDISNLYSGRKINYLTASFGQGIAVTPLQLINGYSAIANGGKLMRPYIIEKIIKGNGSEEITRPEIVGIPFSEKTTGKLKSMLVGVVDRGFDKARIKGYGIAGKTGTAQIPDGSGGYAKDEFIHDFVGFAPAPNPQFVILIKMDRPKGITFAADSLSPTFREMAQFLINYYKIPPTR